MTLMRADARRLPVGDANDEERVGARDALADRVTKLIWERRRSARDTAHEFLTGQARRAGITGDVYLPNGPGYGTGSMRAVLASLDEQGAFQQHPDALGARVGAVAVRHTEDRARRIIREAAEADEATVRAWQDMQAERAASQRQGQEKLAREVERTRERDSRDLRELAVQPGGWARMLTGVENCAFCVMLAARGAVYDGKAEALDGDYIGKFGDAYHDHCDCIAVPVYSPLWDGGKTAAALQKLYERAQDAISDDDLQNRDNVESPDQLRKLRKYLLEHSNELAKAVPNIRHQDALVEQQREFGLPEEAVTELAPHEVRFFHEFGATETFELIRRNADRTSSNDFRWTSRGDVEVEVKRPERASYDAVKRLIRDAVYSARENHGVVKDRFIVDLDDRPLTEKLRRQLEVYNLRNARNSIRKLWVWSRARLTEIDLRTEV
ncbi:hypothetical protein ACFWHR_03925 [Leucobacter sp. NPDC058333]|uniref:VG15 protein n=1 Tax=Leucobacter sp. NPDC058333 TaxID=3346450 RepID=UPI00365F1B2F